MAENPDQSRKYIMDEEYPRAFGAMCWGCKGFCLHAAADRAKMRGE